MNFCALPVLVMALTVQPLAEPEVLEPSVLNEVEHALSACAGVQRESDGSARRTAFQFPSNASPASVEFVRLFETNGLSASERAIRLVSTQRDGRWYYHGTNVTDAAVKLLRDLAR